MSNIYPSISEKLAELNIDIFRYEDIAFASHAIPALSTISQPKFDMGKIAYANSGQRKSGGAYNYSPDPIRVLCKIGSLGIVKNTSNGGI